MTATPANVTLKDLNDQWAMNWKLCDDSEPMLVAQGVPWLVRKLLGLISMQVALKTVPDPATGLTHFFAEYKPPFGLPSSGEERVLDFVAEEITVPVFGTLRVSTRWATPKELDEIDAYLGEGFEKGTKEVIHMKTENSELGVVTHQTFGFEKIKGVRYHTRHIVVKRGGESTRLTLVYDYVGPQHAKKS
ncbi:uncharacterized protein LY89DRAFT_579296 [Mollisia scopiformis]|uniref:Probable pericyclase scpY n=1 Tax=Mollisia scopiformis TaxID=149040 RepID=SCPY_MOLSC|nr:uncharacterized protein LY89DRAFT_579296 [Mollisia scopiformis]A0A194XJX1.1 RecName: Full=Probable pericyclase scpY; AltName: Full=Scp cluster protein Y [Mollisia scopiformis]KUJ20448.1 hypothetical protein LY89DRAFT_579296 [Mollisia scopiformis]